MSVANWITLPNLGSFVESYNFNLNPMILEFEASYGSTVTGINGSLPDGLRWSKIDSTIVIEGESTGVSVETSSNFTLRIRTPDGMVSDRTYYISIVPVQAMPSWSGQDQFLGYAAVGTVTTFTVNATSPTTDPISYRLIRAPQGMIIDPLSGVITYNVPTPSPLPIPYESINQFVIRASVGTLYEDLSVYVWVLGIPHAPAWITDEGQIGSWVIGQYVEYTLEAYDPQGNEITYSFVNPSPGFPFTMTPTGFVYGMVPFTNDEPLYSFTVSATSPAGSTQRTFAIQATQEISPVALKWKNPSPDLGMITDGKVVTIDVGAVSSRSVSVNHSFVGGTLPPNLTLNLSQGMIAGFVEFHPQPRYYHFEINADDGTQSITRRYTLEIKPSVRSQFASIGMTLMGELRESVLETNGFIIGNADLVPYANTERYQLANEMVLINGLDYGMEDPDLFLTVSNVYMHSTNLMMGSISNVSINDSGHQLFYRNVIDPQSGADIVITTPTVNPTTVYPVSLNNMRSDLIRDIGFANDGCGSGATLWPNVNPEQGTIESVTVVNRGNGYYFSPLLSVLGTGNGASLTSTLEVTSVSVINSGYGWTAGEEISLMISESQDVRLSVGSVTSSGGLKTLTVLDGGSFTVFPQGDKVLSNGNGSYALVSFNLSVAEVAVLTRGSGYGYNDTSISIGGEILPSWMPSWQPIIPIGTVFGSDTYEVANRSDDADQLMRNLQPWVVQHLNIDLQGKTWTGNTMFDRDECTFDGGQTAFVEWDEPLHTIFDQDDTFFDTFNTVFDDNNPMFVPMAYRMWGTTIFDKETTVFDIYRTIFDEAGPSTRSITLLRRLYRLKSQQISGNSFVV